MGEITWGDIIGYLLTFIIGFTSGGFFINRISMNKKSIRQDQSIVFGDQIGGNKHER